MTPGPLPGESTPGRAPSRDAALDAGRGLAVLGMIYVHLVPAEAAAGPLALVSAGIARLLEGKSAALFCLLAGMSWAIQARRAAERRRPGRCVMRRALALAVAGVAFHLLVWPTEILLPFALMMPLCLSIGRAGDRAVFVSGFLLVAAAPLIPALLGDYVGLDWNEDGSHGADRAVGWVTLRYLVVDGNYPVVPWMAFPLLGSAMWSHGVTRRAAARKWFWTALVVALLAQFFAFWMDAHAESVGRLQPYLTSSWVPTSIPFVLLTGATAVTVVAGLAWWQAAAGLPRAFVPVALLGRASLTHYLLHIVIVIVPLRGVFPDEDWPAWVGLTAFAAYAFAALPLTVWWFQRHARGPFESVWALSSGTASGLRPVS